MYLENNAIIVRAYSGRYIYKYKELAVTENTGNLRHFLLTWPKGPSELFLSLGVRRRRPLTFTKACSSEATGPNKTKLGLNHPDSIWF